MRSISEALRPIHAEYRTSKGRELRTVVGLDRGRVDALPPRRHFWGLFTLLPKQ